MNRIRFMIAMLLSGLVVSVAYSADGMSVKAGVLADLVWSHSNLQSADGRRQFTLQPSRDRSVGLMQGHAEITGASSSIWWRVAFQHGWFPDANYLGEDSALRFVQEASFSHRLTKDISYTAGVMPSHIGYESMISRDNLTISRSFTADNTPYYETGISSTYATSDNLSISVLLLNGWQRIVDNNDDLALGTALKWKPDSSVVISWNTFLGNEQPRDKPPLRRFHNNVWCEWRASDRLLLVGLFDLGLQERFSGGMSNQWFTGLSARYVLWNCLRIAGRIEHYADPDAIIIQPPSGNAFAATAGSVNADYDITESVLVRAECRSIAYNGRFLNANTATARQSETYFTLSISTRLTTGPL